MTSAAAASAQGAGARTLAALWLAGAAASPAPAFVAQEDGAWREIGWEEARVRVEELAAGFLSLGIAGGDRVAILARTRLEWALCDWALIAIGAITVPIYPTSSALECAYILGSSGARFVICENEAQREKVEPARRELEALETLVVVDGGAAPGAVALPELRGLGRALLAADPAAVDRARGRIAEADPLTIVYTSGTTGPPKGCVLTNRNYIAMVGMVGGIEGLVLPGDRALLHLPLAHTFARLVEFLGPATGLTIAFCPDAAGIPAALRAVRPTLLPSVPRLFEKLASAVRAGIEAEPPLRRAAARRALRAGEAGRHGPRAGLERALAKRLVLRRVRRRLGGRLRVVVSGGASLPPELATFLHALGVTVLEGYGLTECTTAAAFNRPGRFRFGTVGPALDGVELRLADDGEILLRGDNVFSGYYHDDEGTRAALGEDGWLRTGDLGAIDGDGFLTILDRKKDILVTAAGKNVSPLNLEAALEASPYVAQALVVGDRRPYLVALVALDRDRIRGVDEERALALAREAVDGVNAGRGETEQLRRFAVLPRLLSEEENELTPTLKLRRRVCEQHFRDEIERLYGGGELARAGR